MTVYICEDCGKRFGEDEQTNSEHRDGQCPGCLGENIVEESPLGPLGATGPTEAGSSTGPIGPWSTKIKEQEGGKVE